MFEYIDLWQKPPASIRLTPKTVHVWASELTASDAQLEKYKQLLTVHEIDRLNRFYFEKHQRHFGIAHGMLHQVLSRYLNCEPQAIEFDYQSHGKPEISIGQNPLNIQFNLSHSGDIALLAISSGIPIGIDVEQIKSRHYLELAKTIMTDNEYQEFLTVDDAEKESTFFHVWTQKEAVIKALGKGLSFSLKRFNVAVKNAAQLNSLDDELSPAWTLQALNMPKGYKAVFATPHAIDEYKCFLFDAELFYK